MEDAGLIVTETEDDADADSGGRVDADVYLSVEALFAAQAARLIGALTVFTGSRTEAEDLAQEAFVRVLGKGRSMRDPSKAANYLYSAAFNLARSRWRRAMTVRRKLPLIGVGGPTSSAEDTVLNATSDPALLGAVRALPARQRCSVVLRYYGEFSVEETAAAMGVSVNTVKTHLRRALEDLRAGISEGGEL